VLQEEALPGTRVVKTANTADLGGLATARSAEHHFLLFFALALALVRAAGGPRSDVRVVS